MYTVRGFEEKSNDLSSEVASRSTQLVCAASANATARRRTVGAVQHKAIVVQHDTAGVVQHDTAGAVQHDMKGASWLAL